MATTTQRTILSSAKVGTISPKAARRSVLVVKYAKRKTSGKFVVRSYGAASNTRRMAKKK
jgi:hypothetical protein